jgi:hypothetical protein
MHLVIFDIQDKEVFLAEPLQMTYILRPDNMALSEGAALEFSRPDLGDVMGEDSAHGLGNCQFHCPGVRVFLQRIAHADLLYKSKKARKKFSPAPIWSGIMNGVSSISSASR